MSSACFTSGVSLTTPTSTRAPPTARASMSSRGNMRRSSAWIACAGSQVSWPPEPVRIRFVSPTLRPMTSSPAPAGVISATEGSVSVTRPRAPPRSTTEEPPRETETTFCGSPRCASTGTATRIAPARAMKRCIYWAPSSMVLVPPRRVLRMGRSPGRNSGLFSGGA
jgi:hypothetical protein